MTITDRVNPIKITDKETNHVYVLDFDRDSVEFCESKGFNWDEIGDRPATMIPLVWYAAFRRYDRKISYNKTTELLEKLGGMRVEWLTRLRELYDQGMASLIADETSTDEEAAKNAMVTVALD